MAEADAQNIFNVHDAKTNLSRLMDRAHAGEEINLAKAGAPWAKLVPITNEPLPPRKPGRFKGLLDDIPDSVWFEPFYTDEELDSFEGEDFGRQ
ncbi:MAG: type II toxin-antitoxin system prevent-host-death family antitoxin [Sphingomonas sp.]